MRAGGSTLARLYHGARIDKKNTRGGAGESGMMEFGIALAPAADSAAVVKRAEELGFSWAWFYDTQLLCADVFVAMATAAQATTRIRLATGVLIPSNRIAPVAANAVASINRLAPGRVVCGVGTGFTGRRTMGLNAMKLADLREYCNIMQAMWRGETVACELEGEPRKLRFLNPEAGCINIDDSMPLHMSAFGPKARAMTAELAAGWCNFMVSPDVTSALEAMQGSWREAGRKPEALYSTCFALGCVLDEGEAADSERAMAQAGPVAAVALHWLVEDGRREHVPEPLLPLYDEYRKIYATYPADAKYLDLHRGHLMFVREDERALIGPELIRSTSLTGTAAELRERVAGMEAAGYSQLALQLVPGQEHAIEDWARVFELNG